MSLEKQIAEVFNPRPLYWCGCECAHCLRIEEIETILVAEGVDLDSVGEFGEQDGEELSPLGEFYHGPITSEGPRFRCTPEQNRLLLELKTLRGWL